jgi:hypothetical protein
MRLNGLRRHITHNVPIGAAPVDAAIQAAWDAEEEALIGLLMLDEQHTGIILTSEVCVREERSGDLANGRERISGRPVERTGEPECTSYTTYTVTEL